MKRVIIAGYYGFENVGDDAVLWSMLLDLRSSNKDVEYTVISNSPKQTSENYKINSISWLDIKKVVEYLEKSDLLIIGGGGLYNSYLEYDEDLLFSSKNQLFSVFIFQLPLIAAIMDKKIMVYGVGASYINSDVAKEHVRIGIELADVVTVRDTGSKEILKSIGCSEDKVQVTADPVFRLINDEIINKECLGEELENINHPLIGVSIRNWDFGGEPEKTEESISSALKMFCEKYNGTVLLMSFDSGKAIDKLSDDDSIIDRVKSKLGNSPNILTLKGYNRPQQIAAIISKCDLFVGMRLHSIVMAIKNSIPLVGIVYDPKVRNMLNMASLGDYSIDVNEINDKKLNDIMESAYKNKISIQKQMRSYTKLLQERAYLNVEYASELLDSNRVYQVSINNNKSVEKKRIIQFYKKIFLKKFKGNIILEAENQKLNSYKKIIRFQIDEFIKDNEFEKAILLLKKVIETDVNNAEAQYLFAFCLHVSSIDVKKALYHYNLALKYGFDEFWVRYNRGSLLKQLGELDDSFEDLKIANKLNPNHVGVRELLREMNNKDLI